jgi:hypothetical protein
VKGTKLLLDAADKVASTSTESLPAKYVAAFVRRLADAYGADKFEAVAAALAMEVWRVIQDEVHQQEAGQ